jgi:hypothetical protein
MTVAANISGAALASEVCLNPAQARPSSAVLIWLAAIGSLLLAIALFAAGHGTLLRIAIPVGATITALALYFRRPIGYLHFTLWTWFLTPLIRRLVDWRAGFADHNLVLVAPLLVSAIAGLTLLRERRLAGPVRLVPFYLCIFGIFYGLIVGLVRWRLHASNGTSPGEIVYGLFDWLAPLLFGLHLYLRWPTYEEHRDALQKSFVWAVLLLGAYGIYQYVAPPAWDRFWLEHMLSDIGAEAFGRPEPFQIRVWGTMNSPGPFGNFLMAGLLLLFSVRSRIKPLATGVGYSAFLLTLVRTSWLGWLVGLAVLARNSKGRQIPRLLLSLIFLPVLVYPMMLNPQIAAVVTDRLQTLQSTRQDESFQDRSEEYRALLTSLAADPFGEGLSNAEYFHGYVMDSGIIRILYSCGWTGTVIFLTGIAFSLRGMPSGRNSADPIAPICRAVAIAMIFEQLSGNTFVGLSGIILWAFIGLSLSLQLAEQNSSCLPGSTGLFGPNNQTASALIA